MASSDARPNTSDSKGGVPAKRPDSNGGRRGSTTATKTESNMVKKALIVSDRWGQSIHGGITDALHVVIKLLQDMGISVHCTALKATKEEEADAKKLGVTLELPTKEGIFQFREPNGDWLLCPNEYYPQLEELKNVKFVFGFSAFTSIPTFKILSKVFPRASCYLINVFDKYDITPLIVGCSKEELEFRKRIMSDEFKNAKCSFSIGERLHAEYSQLYHSTNQQLLSPIINEEYLVPPRSDKPPILKGEKFKIISVVQEYEFEDPEILDVAIKAVNDAAELIYQFNKTPSVWKIIGTPPRKEKEIAKKLTRSSKLKIAPKIMTSTEELNSELMSSHLVLIPPSTTSYGNLTLAAMCAAIPVVYPKRSYSNDIVSKHIDKLEATECAIDMDGNPQDFTKRIVSVITKYPTAFQRAEIIRDHIKEKVARDLRDSNGSFVASITADMQSTSPHGDDQDTETESTVEHKGNGAKISVESKVSDRKNEADAEKDEVNTAVTELPTEELTAGRADDREHLSGASVDQESKGKASKISADVGKSRESDRKDKITEKEVNEVYKAAEQSGSDGDMDEGTSVKNLSIGRIRRKRKAGKTAADVGKSRKSDRKDKTEKEEDEVHKVAEQPGSDEDMAETTSDKNISTGRIRRKGQIEIKVEPDGIIPKRGKSVAEVDAAFFSNKQTKGNALLVGKQLDQRHKHMELHDMGEGSISYIMDCQSSEALESLMDDYSSGSLYRMVKSTFLSESLLDEIGALYLSLGTSIDYEEYLLCQEELEGNDIYHLPIEVIEEMKEEITSDILREQVDVTMIQHTTRQKATDRDILREMSDERERGRQTELDELMNEWIKIRTELQQLNASYSESVFDRQEFVRNTGAIIDEVDIPVGIKQELMIAFEKILPLGPDKTGKPDQKLVIEGDVLMEYVENIVHDFDIPTKGKQDIIEQFRKLVQAKSRKRTAKASLTAKQEDLQERIQAIVDDANTPDEQKEVYKQLRQVERGSPLKNSVWKLSRRGGKPGEVWLSEGLTISQNGRVVVCDYGPRDQPGSVKTVTADTAQILTSVTVHGLPRNFRPRDTQMADNGDHYTVDEGNKCIVVSDAKSEVKQIIAMGKLKDPTGVFVDKDRNVFIADYGADRIIKCNGDGDIISSQQLSKPWSLTMNSKYQLIVSCQGNVKCIYVLDSNLEILNHFGSGHLNDPRGVTVDNADNIYAADSGKIVKFDRQGEYKETVTKGVYPYYVAMLTDDCVVYSDWVDSVRMIHK